MTTPTIAQDGKRAEPRSTNHDPESSRRIQALRSNSRNSGYDVPDVYANLDEIAAPSPVHNPDETSLSRVRSFEERRNSNDLEKSSSRAIRERRVSLPQPSRHPSYDVPDNYANLDELATPSPVENPDENPIYRHRSLEEFKEQEHEYQQNQQMEIRDSLARGGDPEKKRAEGEEEQQVSRLATQLYTISYLILFSFFGTLARLGLQAITFYPGAPVVLSVLWANVGGSLFMGFLSEDRMLFKEEWGTPAYDLEVQRARQRAQDEESGSNCSVDLQAAKKAHAATKKTIPLYIGLATGFCGCFTSFSSFIRDAFLATSNSLSTPLNHPADYQITTSTTSTVPRNGGYSFMALAAVLITNIALSISGLYVGAHIAIASEPLMPSLPFAFCRKILDRLAVFLAWGCWLGTILLAIFPPDRNSSGAEIWRGRAVFALVFAPLGCLGRFSASLYLNGRLSNFPLGTFVVNIFGTAVLGMCWDLQHVPLGGIVSCQVLQGIEDGFCGCLTTVSTWVSELSTLRRGNAYRYGALSVIVALCLLIVVMGSMQWTRGYSVLLCTH